MRSKPGKWCLWIGCAGLCLALVGRSADAQAIVQYTQTLKANSNFTIDWCTIDNSARFRLTAKATGWLGIGFNDVRNMAGADVIMATGEGAIQDAFADRHAAPAKDGSQNVTMISSSQASGTTVIEFSRPINTADVNDDFTLDKARYLVWAYNATQDGFNREHTSEGSSSAKYNFSAAAACVVPFSNDFNGDKVVDVADINALLGEVRAQTNASKFDVNSDKVVDTTDISAYLLSAFNSYIGDSTLDGVFGSADFVQVFSEGTYEDAIPYNSNWQQGDWNGDADFNSGDLVFAFSEGGYEAGPRAAIASVPEPSALVLVSLGLASVMLCTRRRRAS